MNPPKGTANGQMRWWVYRVQLRPVRFGETRATVVWAIRPVIGKGDKRRPIGGATYKPTRRSALDWAHRESRRIYGRKTRA